MATARISKRTVDQAEPGARDAFLWDSELRGFGLKVTPAGRKVYLVQYRLGGRSGRTQRVTIGPHGAFTPDKARDEARRLLGEAAAGRDPKRERTEEWKAPTVAAVAEKFLAEHVEAKRKARTASEYRRLCNLFVLPSLGRRRVAEVQRSDVARLHHSMRETPYQANRVLALLSKLFSWADQHGYRPEGANPCRHVEKFPERKRERFLSEAELARLAAVLREGEGRESPFVLAALRLLVFTGARLNEVLTLRWEHVDFANAMLRLPDSKTGQKTIYLSAPALEVLASLPRLDGNPHVICGDKPGAHLVNLQLPWRRLRARAGLENVRLHDLRHSFASVGAAGGLSLPVLGALLGHRETATTHRYAHLSADPLRAANDAIAARLSAAMSGTPKGEPIRLKAPRRR